MSNVKKNARSIHRFTVLDSLLDLYNHTTTVLANEKIFDRKYQFLISRIEQECAMAYHRCRTANEDFDNRKKEEAKIRIKLQTDAIESLLYLKTDIRLAQRVFHLRSKKAVYWNDLVNECLKSVKGWRSSEMKIINMNGM